MNTTTMSRKARIIAISLAKYMVADEAFENESRWIRKEDDFTGMDKVIVSEYTDKIMKAFEENNGGKWDNVLAEIRKISNAFHFGFRAQYDVIEHLTNYGYKFN